MRAYFEVHHGTGEAFDARGFRTFAAAERYARRRVKTVDERGCAKPATIQHPDYGTATVRLDGAERLWTDLTLWWGPT